MPNLSALLPNATRAITLANLVLVTPETPDALQPQNPPKKGGMPNESEQPEKLLFHYSGEQMVNLQSDITDHYVEDNTAVQDQIALKPEEYTVTGYIGELNDIVPALIGDFNPKFIANKLSVLGAYVPGLTTTAQQTYAKTAQAYQTAQRAKDVAVSAWNTLGFGRPNSNEVVGGSGVERSKGVQNKQQVMFQALYGYWRERRLFSVQTPWALFRNMAIKNLQAVQNPDTNRISDFIVTFKMIRNAKTSSVKENVSKILQGRLGAQTASVVNTGTSTGSPGPSLGAGLSEMGVT